MNVEKYLKLGLIDSIDPSRYSLGELIQLLNQHKLRVLLDVKSESPAYYQLKREELQKSNRDIIINKIRAIEDIECQNAERKGEVINLPLENVDSILKGMTGVKGNIDYLINDSEGFNPEHLISNGSLYLNTIAEIDSRYLIKLMTDNFEDSTTWTEFINDEDRFVKMDLDELLYDTNDFSELSENCISILQNQLSNSSGCSELSWAEVMKTFEIDEWRILLIRKKTK
jgi:hypothetical protein